MFTSINSFKFLYVYISLIFLICLEPGVNFCYTLSKAVVRGSNKCLYNVVFMHNYGILDLRRYLITAPWFKRASYAVYHASPP